MGFVSVRSVQFVVVECSRFCVSAAGKAKGTSDDAAKNIEVVQTASAEMPSDANGSGSRVGTGDDGEGDNGKYSSPSIPLYAVDAVK